MPRRTSRKWRDDNKLTVAALHAVAKVLHNQIRNRQHPTSMPGLEDHAHAKVQ